MVVPLTTSYLLPYYQPYLALVVVLLTTYYLLLTTYYLRTSLWWLATRMTLSPRASCACKHGYPALQPYILQAATLRISPGELRASSGEMRLHGRHSFKAARHL